MKKKFLFQLCALVACLACTLSAGAYDFMSEGIYYTISSGTNVSVANNGSFGTYSGDIFIPSTVTYNGVTYNVTSVGSQSFRGCTGLTSVRIPEGVHYIMGMAFYGCSALKRITIPSSVYTIYTQAFAGCTSLTDVFCLGTNPPNLATGAFDSSAYTQVTIHVPKGSQSAYDNASVWATFYHVVVLPYDFVVDGVFYAVTGTRPATVEVTNNGSIDTYIEQVVIPATVTYGGVEYAITSIADSAFYTNYEYVDITCYCLTPPALHANSINATEIVTVPYEVLEDYYYADGWSTAYSYAILGQMFDFVENSISYKITGDNTAGVAPGYIGYLKETGHNSKYVWYGAQHDLGDNIDVPATVTHVGKTYAVTAIGECAFFGIRMKHVNLPNTITEIGRNSFAHCTNLTAISIPEGVTDIQDYAFYDCQSIESVSLPSGLTRIGEGAFMYLYKWRVDLVIPDNVTGIQRGAFYQCYRMQSVTLGSKVAWVGARAFDSIDSISTITCKSDVPPVLEVYEYESDGDTYVNQPFDSELYYKAAVRVPYGSHEAYLNADEWKNFRYIVSDQVVTPTISGDVNGDKLVNMDDLAVMINYLLTDDATGIDMTGADLTGDISVGMDDLALLINCLLTNSTPGTVGEAQHKFLISGVPFTMVNVDGGTFMMGNANISSSRPVHQVNLSGYSIGQTEVTQALWKTVMRSNPSYFTGDLNRPVENVNWNECQDFVNMMKRLTGMNFRLPTEAEWEFAARGGNKSQGFDYAGSNNLDDVGWYLDNSDDTTHPVATKAPNELGLYDMTGNVFEWCQDWWGAYSSAAQVNPQGPAEGSERVCRSAGFNRSGTYNWFYNTGRTCDYPDQKANDTGLRLAL